MHSVVRTGLLQYGVSCRINHDACDLVADQRIGADWYQNKVVHSWYLPSLVQYLSKIPSEVCHCLGYDVR